MYELISKQHLLESIPDYIWITDKQHRYIAGSEKSAKILGFNSLDDMIDKSLQDIPCGARLGAAELCKQRDYVLENKATIEVLDIHPFRGEEIRAHHAIRHPFYNENNDLVGVLVTAREINHKLFVQIMYSLTDSDKKFYKNNDLNRSYEILSNGTEILSQRELECYFYVLRGYTAKQIASALGNSVRTVETHLNNIKVKMQCTNKSDLIERGLLSGILSKVPLTLISNISIVL